MNTPVDAATLAQVKAAHAHWKALRDHLRDGTGDGLSTIIAEEQAAIACMALLDDTLPALVAGCETLLAVERRYRAELWLHHGHAGVALYGDDGEMQCSRCRQWDYRRAPLDELEQQVADWRIAAGLATLDAAREEPTR